MNTLTTKPSPPDPLGTANKKIEELRHHILTAASFQCETQYTNEPQGKVVNLRVTLVYHLPVA